MPCDDKQLVPLLENIIASTDGCVTIYTQHLQSGFFYQHNANERYFMASIFKILIAVYCLQLVEQGKLNLQDPIEILPTDIRPYGILDKYFTYPGVSLSFYNVLRLMLQLSDNTATDVVLRLLGGIKTVKQAFADTIFADMDLTHTCLTMLLMQSGVKNIPDNECCTLAEIQQLIEAVPSLERAAAEQAFNAVPPNTATAAVIGQLLAQIQNNIIVTKPSADLIINWMRGCRTGVNRIRALLPAGILVADKTGTLTGNTHDAAIIELPQNKGQLILVVLIKNSSRPKEQDEKVIAHIARTVFDFVLLSY